MPTIGGSVIQNAWRVPDREALISSGRRWTWAELDDDVARAAGRLAAVGLGRGDRCAVLSTNTPEMASGAAASRWGTRRPTPLHPVDRMRSSVREVNGHFV